MDWYVARKRHNPNERKLAHGVFILCECAHLSSVNICLWNMPRQPRPSFCRLKTWSSWMAQTRPRILVLVCAVAMFTNLRAKFCLGLFENPDHAPSPIFVFKNVEYDNSFPCAQIIQLVYNPLFIVLGLLFRLSRSVRFSRVTSTRPHPTNRTRSWVIRFQARLSSVKKSLTCCQPPIGESSIT